MRVLPRLSCLALVTALAACGGAPAPNELQIDNDGGGKFSGNAGPDWTADELKREAGAMICNGAEPAQFSPRTLEGYWIFSGNC